MVDSLTGIANRRAFLQDGAELTKRHAANPCPTAVLLIDLDHFKSINDRFGHALGDRVLEIFTDAARQSIRFYCGGVEGSSTRLLSRRRNPIGACCRRTASRCCETMLSTLESLSLATWYNGNPSAECREANPTLVLAPATSLALA